MNLKNYDFMDFGSGHGGCLKFATRKLGGRSGLGVERMRNRAEKIVSSGYSCMCGDITKLELPKKAVRFITISHLLEHLHTLADVERVVKLAINTATDFVMIEGPSFDFDDYLADMGFKFFWKDSCGHKFPLKTSDIQSILKRLGVQKHSFLTERPYTKDSTSPDILPITVGRNELQYNPKNHPRKDHMVFKRGIFRSFMFFLWLNGKRNKAVLGSRAKFSPDKLPKM